MFLMYVDDSGDSGLINSPTKYFILSALVVHESHWRASLDAIIHFRRQMKAAYGLPVRAELHAAEFLNRPGKLAFIKKNDRLNIMRRYADILGSIPNINFVNVVVEKSRCRADADPFEIAWNALIQRFENTIGHGNFPGSTNRNEKGMIFSDHTDDKKLRAIMRRMRHFNIVPGMGNLPARNLQLVSVIEDANMRNSIDSYFIQSVDLSAYLLHQKINPNSYMRKKGGANYFARIGPNLCRVATYQDPLRLGIVWRH